MNWLDIVLIVAIVAGTLSGIRTGMIKSVISLAGLIVGVILAGRYYGQLAEQLTFISQDSLARIVAFIIILAAVAVLAALAVRLLKWLTSLTMLGWVDRLGGGVLGLLMAALFCSVLLAVWVKFLGVSGSIVESGLATMLLGRFPLVLSLLPTEFDAVRSFFY